MLADWSDGRCMLLIAVGLTVALVAADILELPSRRSAQRAIRWLDRSGP